MFGEQGVEAGEIAEATVLSGEARIAAVVIIDRVVEPGGDLDAFLRRRDFRHIGIGRVGQLREIGFARILVAHETGIDRRSA